MRLGDSKLLSSAESLQKAVLTSLPAASVMVFDHDLNLLLAGGEALRTHGYDPDDMTGRNLAEIAPPGAFEFLRPKYEAALHGVVDEFEMLSTDGTRCYLMHIGPLFEGDELVAGVVFSREIADRQLSGEHLRLADGSFESAFTKAPIGMALVALDGTFLRANAALSRLIGYSPEEISRLTFQSITHPDDLEEDLELINQLLHGSIEDYEMEKRYITRDGNEIWVSLAVSLNKNKDGTPLNFISQIQDISERKEFEEQLKRVASEDSLTGLANRRQLEIELEKQFERCRRYGESAALLMVDLDKFKSINDNHGHAAGDAVLRAVASELTARTRTNDIVARIGGDEFAILMVGGQLDTANRMAEELMARFDRRKVSFDGQVCGCPASVGAAVILEEDRNIDDVMKRADREMYSIKQVREGKC